jgi:hypothetical protein
MTLAIVYRVFGAVTACGATASAQSGAAPGPILHVIRSEDDAAQPSVDTYVRDWAAVQRLYNAALKLPLIPAGLYNCPADNGVVYHLTFIGGTLTARHMDLDAAGCRFLVIGDVGHMSTDAFIALFVKTVGLPSLDPGFPYS